MNITPKYIKLATAQMGKNAKSVIAHIFIIKKKKIIKLEFNLFN